MQAEKKLVLLHYTLFAIQNVANEKRKDIV
jgi:hypothetical protein